MLTVRLCPDEERDALEPLDVGGGDVARALVVPLPVRVQRVQLHAPPRVRHLEEELALRTPARFDGVKFQFGGSGRGRVRIEGDEAGPAGGGGLHRRLLREHAHPLRPPPIPLTWAPSSLTTS